MSGARLLTIMTEEFTTQIGRRRDSRLRVEVPARLVTLSGHHNASLCDLSQSGAQFRTSTELKCGEEGVLTWLDFETFGQLVWVRNGFAGMEFDELIVPDALIQTRDRADYGLAKSEERIEYERARNWFRGYR